jgi:nitronate monooxygenase
LKARNDPSTGSLLSAPSSVLNPGAVLPFGRVTRMLGCAVPILSAAMGGPARAELVTAVSRAGGFGTLGMVREPPSLIEHEVSAVRAAGIERFAVNVIPAATDPDLLENQIRTIIRLGVPVVSLFWDLDARVVARLKEAGTVVIYQVGSVAEAIEVQQAGADIVIAQGLEAGGHVRSQLPLRKLLPAVIDVVDLPVLAAGGMATPEDLLTAMALGAEGAVLGTAFLASSESFAHAYHKQRLVAASGRDTVLTQAFHINWPPGASVRVLASEITRGERGEAQDFSREVIAAEAGRPIYLFSTDSPLQTTDGRLELMALYAGTGVGAITAVRPAADIVRDLIDGAAVAPLGTVGLVHGTTELASPVCYIGEMSGTYVGEPEADEILSELEALLRGMRELLRAGLADPTTPYSPGQPVFPPEGATLARWIARLAVTVGWSPDTTRLEVSDSRVSPADRLARLIPRLPESSLRTGLIALRLFLESAAAPP